MGTGGGNQWVKTARFKGLWRPPGEVQIALIFENHAKSERIFHRNRKQEVCRDFRRDPGYQKGRRSPIWAYFTVSHNRGL